MPDAPLPEKKRLVWPWLLVGCGCLAALGVPALIVVAIALPGMSGPRAASFEAMAVGAMRSYCGAQVMYHRNDWDGNEVLEYATPFNQLYSTRDGLGNEIVLIDAALAAAAGPGGSPKHGYVFQDMSTIGGEKIDWVNDYALCATPAVYGKTGRRTFIVNTNGTIFGKDLGRSELLTHYPKDPVAEGWMPED